MSLDTCVILGVGGHGWESLYSFMHDYAGKVISYGTTVDWGGSTGYWGRLLEFQNDRLNLELHGKALPVLPWGDFNKMMIGLGKYKYSEEVLGWLDFRTLKLEELLNAFEELSLHWRFQESFKVGFKAYLNQIFAYHNQYHDNFEVKPVCLAYPLNQYIFWKNKGMSGLNKFYHELHILPANIDRYFVSNWRQVLIAKNLFGQKLVGEDKADNHSNPLLPESIHHRTKSNKVAQVSQAFLDDLEKSEIVIIPNGSIANWLPLINIESVAKILVKKSTENRLVWILNLFRTGNEQTIGQYLEYLNSKNILPIMIGPKHIPIQPPAQILDKYLVEGKIPNLVVDSELSFLDSFSQKIHLEIDCHIKEGYKYDPLSVAKILTKILK